MGACWRCRTSSADRQGEAAVVARRAHKMALNFFLENCACHHRAPIGDRSSAALGPGWRLLGYAAGGPGAHGQVLRAGWGPLLGGGGTTCSCCPCCCSPPSPAHQRQPAPARRPAPAPRAACAARCRRSHRTTGRRCSRFMSPASTRTRPRSTSRRATTSTTTRG